MHLYRLCCELLCLIFVLSRTTEAAEPPIRLGGPYKLLAADFTGNGHLDLAIGLHDLGMLTIEQGNGKGHFQHLAVTPILPDDGQGFIDGSYNLAGGDLNGDGRPDLAVGCMGHFVLLARNAGGGRFESKVRFPTESDAKGVSLADLDGRLDLRRGLGGWQFGDPVKLEAGISAYYVETADLNADGLPDVLVPNELGSTVSYWISPGRSIFNAGSTLNRQVIKTSGFRINDVRARDFTGDGRLDILTANWLSSSISLFPGRGDGTFGDEQLMPGGKHCVFFAVGDFDKDSDLDFAVTHWTEDFLSVFINDGRGQFPPRIDYKTGLGNYGVLAFDANGDGRLDLVTANYRHRSTSLLIGRGDGTFAPAVTTRRSFRQTPAGFVLERPSG